MDRLTLSIITPQKIVYEDAVDEVIVPTVEGEIGILPHHVNLFSLLKEGIVTIKKDKKEDSLAIGGGYVQTDGHVIKILVSHAFGQHEIDVAQAQKAIDDAQKVLSGSKDAITRKEADAILRRSLINLKLIKRRKQRTPS